MSERTTTQQEIIDIIETHFPASGLPNKIVVDENYIAISSWLCNLSIEYQHKDFVSKNDRICIYDRKTLTLIHQFQPKYHAYTFVILGDLIFIATGVYGDYLRGELLCFDASAKEVIKCADEKRPVHWLVLKDNLMEIFTYKSTGYYESEAEKFIVINPDRNLFFDFDNEEFTSFDEDDMEEIINEDSNEKRLQLLKTLIP